MAPVTRRGAADRLVAQQGGPQCSSYSGVNAVEDAEAARIRRYNRAGGYSNTDSGQTSTQTTNRPLSATASITTAILASHIASVPQHEQPIVDAPTRPRRQAAVTARARIAAISQRRRRTIQASRIRNSLSPLRREMASRAATPVPLMRMPSIRLPTMRPSSQGPRARSTQIHEELARLAAQQEDDDDDDDEYEWILNDEYDPAESWSDQEDDDQKALERALQRKEDTEESRNKCLPRTKEHGPCTICFKEEVVQPVGCMHCMNFLGCHKCLKRWTRIARAHSLTVTPSATCPLCRAVWSDVKPDVTVHFGRENEGKISLPYSPNMPKAKSV